MYISNIKIKNYRNFENFSRTFQKGLNIITGCNNSGKTNLLHAINLIKNPEDLTVHDFNKNNLKKYFQDEYRESAPSIEIEYEIQHDISIDDEDDESIIKLIYFLGLDKIKEVVQEENTEDKRKYSVLANVKIRYAIDEKHIEKYKDLIKEATNLNEYISALDLSLKYYDWKFENGETGFSVSKEDVTSIFNIDFIEAERNTEAVLKNVRKQMKEYIKLEDNRVKITSMQDEISNLIKQNVQEVIDTIQKIISEESNDIGLKNGNVSIAQDIRSSSVISDSYIINVMDTKSDCILPLSHNGVGYNNLINIYMLIKFAEVTKEKEYRILCIEEPEAHLHPAMQYKLFLYLRRLNEEDKLKQQIFISTHSSNITAVAGLDNIYSLQYSRENEKNDVVSISLKEQFENDELAKNHMMKFLDVTRSDMLFADKVIFVEGIAEKLLLPAFMKKIGCSYEDNHISIVEIGGKHFKYFLRAFVDNSLNRKVLCITDKDYTLFEEVNNVIEVKSLSEIKEFIPTHIEDFFDKENIKYVIQDKYGKTFEDELILNNIDDVDILKKLLKIAMPESLHTFIEEAEMTICYWDDNRDKLPVKSKDKVCKILDIILLAIDSYSDDKETYEKLFFANLFYEYVKNKKGDVALKILIDDDLIESIKVPSYIEEGVEWLMR